MKIQQIGRRKLRMINNSQNLIDLKVPPSNKLEKLAGLNSMLKKYLKSALRFLKQNKVFAGINGLGLSTNYYFFNQVIFRNFGLIKTKRSLNPKQ